MSEWLNERIKQDLKAQLDLRLKYNNIHPIDHAYATQSLETNTHPNLAIREGHESVQRSLESIRKKYSLREL